MFHLFLLFIQSLLSVSSGMNMNGDIYNISNPNKTSTNQFSTNYQSNYFDVYSLPITSRYGDVYWTMMDDVLLPDHIVKEYDNKTMAIVGYEMNQVFKTDNGDVSVPITWAYNHHYEAYLLGSKSKLVTITKNDTFNLRALNHGASSLWKTDVPNSQFFSEGNGGESRGSFHGYSQNMAQLIKSPKIFKLQPMQIDTRNRDPKYINTKTFHPGLLPKESAAPPNASYSGLLECPCTDRLNFSITHHYNTLTQGVCDKIISNISTCFIEVSKLGRIQKNVTSAKSIQSKTLPYGCFFYENLNAEITSIYYNTFESKHTCGVNNKEFGITQFEQENINISITIDYTKPILEQMNITLSGPSNLWYGVAFNAKVMNDLPYAILINGTGSVFEYKLGNHELGQLLDPSLTIKSNKVDNTIRTLVLSRPLKGLSQNYFDFTNRSNIPLLAAIGNSGHIAYHHLKSSNTISITSLNGLNCLCDNGSVGSINGIPFSKLCAPEPTADLLQQRNPTCFIETYQGGLSCCHHKNILLDKDQIQPLNEMTYHLKFRFWYEDYKNHKSLIRPYFQTEAYSGEYDVPKCPNDIPPEECIHSITARWKVIDMISQHDRDMSKTLRLAYAGPHCHAPSCISMELYNADTGDLICKVDGIMGNGNPTNKFDEKGYIKLNPCVWGFEDGLLEPPLLDWNTNLISIKKNNNTNAHYGEMASWQMRAYLE